MKNFSLAVLIAALTTASVHSFTSVTTSTFVPNKSSSVFKSHHDSSNTKLYMSNLSNLPVGISPFERSVSKSLDIQGDFRKRALDAIIKAQKDNVELMEIEFPPLLGGDKAKSQFDDFDNVQELNQNQDWCIQLLPALNQQDALSPIWFILPDLKECELAKEEWTGSRYRESAAWTTIEAVTEHYSNGEYSKPWGATFASGMNTLMGGSKGDAGLLGDVNAMDDLSTKPKVHLVCQPGNGGPVEDWINVEKIHNNAMAANDNNEATTTVVVNGALDKVRDGYYPAIFFPDLAKTVNRFYKNFESVFFIKPLSDKGLYGWLFRVYPEPWQVVLQTVQEKGNGDKYIQDTVVHVSDERPSYTTAIQKMLQGAQELQKSQ